MAERAVFVAAGKRGAARRWGPRRVVKLAELDPATAGVIRAILNAAENAQKAESAIGDADPATSTGGTRNATSTD